MTGEINVVTNIGDPIPILNGDLGGTKAITMDAQILNLLLICRWGNSLLFCCNYRYCWEFNDRYL